MTALADIFPGNVKTQGEQPYVWYTSASSGKTYVLDFLRDKITEAQQVPTQNKVSKIFKRIFGGKK